MRTKAIFIMATIGLAAFVPANVYAIPSFLQKQVAKECGVSRDELRKSNEDYRRCIQQIGGREMIKDKQCANEKLKQEASTENYERCEYQVLGKSLDAASSKS